jgi:hypothetical protein
MVSARSLARAAALVALLGFVFPWVLVSCSGQPVGRLTGIDLATGGLTLPQSAGDALRRSGPNLWVILALAAVIAGLAVSFLASGRRAMLGLGAAAVVALAASGLGVASASSSAPDEALRPPPSDAGAASPDPSGGGLVQVQLQYGYFITLAGLLTAIGACGMALAGREKASE